ncbi:MAG TPA: PilZ domain-containing protein [Gemmataceae bacterium]|nr:PilZ domain-containing protein [Gemmataceae bacterium]
MTMTDLQTVANAVVRRAERQGFVLPSEIRAELAHLSMPQKQWKEVVALSRPVLRFRQGRYYYQAVVSPRMREEKRHQRAIHLTVRQLIREYKKTHALGDRRQQGRADFIQPVKVRIENQRELAVLSRDLSETGIRLIGTQSLLGQKVEVVIPRSNAGEPYCIRTRILWTCSVGDGLYENGGTFLEMVENRVES